MRSEPARDSSGRTGAPCAAGRFPAGVPACCRPLSSRASSKPVLPQRRFRPSSRPAAAPRRSRARCVRRAGRRDRAPVPHPREKFAVGRQRPADRLPDRFAGHAGACISGGAGRFHHQSAIGAADENPAGEKDVQRLPGAPGEGIQHAAGYLLARDARCAQTEFPGRASSRSPPPRRARSGAPRQPRTQRLRCRWSGDTSRWRLRRRGDRRRSRGRATRR